MPEGDALHRIAARLQVLVGERVEASSPHPRGAATRVARVVDGLVLESVDAVGKHLLLRFEGDVVVRSHLRMSGRWRVREVSARPWSGRPWLVLRTAHWEASQWNGPFLALDRGGTRHLGPDLLDATHSHESLVAAVRSADPARSLGDALLDQRVVAGIGTMWLAELLWHARVSPWLAVGAVLDDELEIAVGWARDAMRGSVAGVRPSRRAVYRRAGRPCPRCGAAVRSRGIGDHNRTAYWCPGCQRGPDPPS